jgi:hypothetical protein
MSKATRNKGQAARERIAAQQAAARRAGHRRRMLVVAGSVGLVLVIVIGFVVIKALSKPGKPLGSGALPPAVASEITNVPVNTQAAVGTGGLVASSLPLKAVSDKPLTSANEPEMLYIGAEFCPYCAAMRWSMAVALSRFGHLGPLTGTHSAPAPEAYPSTATLTFRHQLYSSPYLTFRAIENQTVSHKQLETPTRAEQALWAKYDTSAQGLGYPFIDFGNRVVLTGPLYDPQVLQGLSAAQIASQLKNPDSVVARNIDGAANYLTASICKMTGNKPAAVCAAAPIRAIVAKL